MVKMGSFVKFRNLDPLKWPKMAQNPPIFLDDVIDYLGRFTLLNQAKKMGLEKCYLEMVWFIGDVLIKKDRIRPIFL